MATTKKSDAKAQKPTKAAKPAKKPTHKAVVKATAPAKKAAKATRPAKKPTKKAESVCAGYLLVATDDKAFWVNNGPVVSTLDGLREALATMTDEQFDYHTKRAGNDFAKWVDEVLCHGPCAGKLDKAKTRSSAVKAIATCACK
jgi:outer membrane biosynthesis protein TonB